jgi:prolyl oligopeptidase
VLTACGGEPPSPRAGLSPSVAASAPDASATERIPMTRKVDVVDDYHGTKVNDAYRWLEESDSSDVKAWTLEQNAHTRRVLDAIPHRDALRGQIRHLLEVGVVSPPAISTTRSGARRYFHVKREGAQNQPVLYVRDGVGGGDRVLIDPAALSADGTTALDWWHPSHDGSLLAWGRSESGSEESTLYVRDVSTGQDLPDRIEGTRYASVAWLPDAKGFYYTRYPERGTVAPGDERYYSRVYFHVIGNDPKLDPLVFGEGREKTDVMQVLGSPDGRRLVVRVHQGWDRSEVYVRDLSLHEKGKWIAVAAGTAALFEPIVRNDKLYVLTNDGAPRYRLYAVDYAHVERPRWKEILPEGPDVLSDVEVIGRELVATYMHDAATRIERFSIEGKSLGAVQLPTIGTAAVSGAWDGDEAFVQFTSYVTPHEVSRLDLKTGTTSPWDKVGASFSALGVTVSRLYAKSRDGTSIPMFVVAKEGAPHNGATATVLYGYGGFNINMTPAFSARALLTVERGGIWVTAVLRGGGEFGEAWHKAGMLSNKQNVFDDVIACAEQLIAEGITSPDKLAIMGGSNGGLLVAAAVTQRPELFRVGLSLVPLTDMLRYHRYRIGKLWVPEYGTSDDADQFKFLYAYSPYHRVRDATSYPSMLFTTAESDSRVDPMHARKMAARMQEAQVASDRPILLRVESKAGHGQGKPVTKLVDEMVDELGFMFRELGVVL